MSARAEWRSVELRIISGIAVETPNARPDGLAGRLVIGVELEVGYDTGVGVKSQMAPDFQQASLSAHERVQTLRMTLAPQTRTQLQLEEVEIRSTLSRATVAPLSVLETAVLVAWASVP